MRRTVVLFLVAALGLRAESLDWAKCVELSGQAHPDLISAQQDVVSAVAQKKSARSDTLPSVDASASLAKALNGDKNRSSSIGLSASQILWDGGATRSAVRSAGASVDSARAALWLAQAQVRYDLRVAYLELWQHQEMTRVLAAIEKLRETNHRMISLRYEGGTEHRGAELQAKAKLAQAKAQVSQEERSAHELSRVLAKAMGTTLVEDFTITETPVALSRPPEKGDLDAIALAHPTVVKSDAAVRVAQAAVDSAKTGFGPKVTAGASAGRSDEEDFTPSQNSASLSVNLNWALVDFGSRSAAVQKARATLVSAQAQAINARRTVAIALEKAWNNYKAALEDDDVAQESLAAATERNKIAKAQYEVGLITYDNWTVIEDDFVSAQKEAINAHEAALAAEAAWINAKGEIYGED